MANVSKNTDQVTTTLIDRGEGKGNVNKILICNKSAHAGGAVIDLYLEDKVARKTYMVINLVMPVTTSLVLEDNVSFDSRLYDLKIKNSGTSPSISVIVSYG